MGSEVCLRKKYYSLLAILVLAYLYTIIIVSPDSAALARYNITATQLRLLSLTLIIPIFAIWFAGVYGLVNVGNYARKIRGTRDGNGFRHLAIGLVFLGLLLPITGVVSRILLYAVQHDIITQALSTIINTHLSVGLQLLGFLFLFTGSWRLVRSAKKAYLPRSHLIATGAALVVLGAFYIFATLSNPSRETPVAPTTQATYYMPDWLILTTITLPYILAWAFGFYAALFLHAYHRGVGGKIYKKALMKLNKGFFVVIIASMLLQFIGAATTVLYGLGLGAALLLLYVLLLFIAVGYVFIALGAKDLAQLEEVT